MSDSTQELDWIPPRFVLYLKARAMRDDDRTMPYIAKKLGFNNASSVDSLLKRYDWFYRWHNKQTLELLDRLESMAAYDPSGMSPVINPREIQAERAKLKESR